MLDGERFIPPPEDYDPAVFRESSWYVKGGQLKYDITLEVHEPMASIVSETERHPTQRITRIDDERVELYACIPDLEEAARWILSCSPYVKVIRPAELKNIVCELAGKVIEINGL